MIISLLLFFTALLLFYLYFLTTISTGIKKVQILEYLSSIKSYVTVIIPFRNEAENILASLESVSSQKLGTENFEVIYIDDNSDDNSYSLLESADKPQNIKILKSPFGLGERAHKKKALKNAIENAKGEIIITTDADCIHGPDWLKTMLAYFDDQTAFVSGPVEFSSNGSLFDKLQRIEFSSLILVGAGLIGAKNPIICNAANLGFRKKIFNEVGGYDDNLKLSSGDDEFLMQKIHRTTNYKIKFCFDRNAISSTKPNSSLNQFYQQRRRWASKGFHYVDNKITITLVLIFLFYLSLPAQLFLGIFSNSVFLLSLLVSLITKFIYEYKVVQLDSNGLFKQTKLSTFLLAELLHVPYILISGFSGLVGNYEWKGRKIKR